MRCGLALTVSVPPGLVARSRIETTALSPALLACLLVLLTCALRRGDIAERGRAQEVHREVREPFPLIADNLRDILRIVSGVAP